MQKCLNIYKKKKCNYEELCNFMNHFWHYYDIMTGLILGEWHNSLNLNQFRH